MSEPLPESLPESLPDLPAGIYRHWKNHLYLVLGYASDSTNAVVADRTVVVYVGLEMTGSPSPHRMHVRTAAQFFEWVDPATGDTTFDRAPGAVPRFAYVGPSAF